MYGLHHYSGCVKDPVFGVFFRLLSTRYSFPEQISPVSENINQDNETGAINSLYLPAKFT